ncbi:MAG TPA: hypothetical protein VF422_01220, partial [Dokdonella sp.]
MIDPAWTQWLDGGMSTPGGGIGQDFATASPWPPASLCQPPATAAAWRCSDPHEVPMDLTPGRITRIASYLVAIAMLLLVLMLHLL